MEELSRQFKTREINEKQLKEAVRELAKGYGKDIGIDFEVVYLDKKTMPKDSEGSTGSAYIVDEENKRVLIPIDIEKIKKTGDLFGTITEEISHGKDALEGRQDKKVAEDKSNDEKGLESLGRPANDYVKNKLGEDNNSKIKLSTDGIDLTNADVGEKVGDVAIALPVAVGAVVVAGFILPEENKEAIKKATMQVYEDIKEDFNKLGKNIKISYIVVKSLIEEKLKEKGITADVKIDKDENIMYTMTPVPEDKRNPQIPPFPLPEEEKNPQLPPMDPPKQETQKERWEREERDRREQKEKDNERSKPNGIPLPEEKPVTVYYTEKTKKEREKVKTKAEILEEIGKADQKLDVQEGIKKQNRNFKKRRVYETKEGYIIYADDFHSKVEYEVFKNGKHVGTIPAETIKKNGFHKEDIDTSKKDPKKRIDK